MCRQSALTFVLLVSSLLQPLETAGQEGPDWHQRPPRPTSLVDFVSGTGVGATQAEARGAAYSNALTWENARDSVSVASSLKQRTKEILHKGSSEGAGESISRIVSKLRANHGTSTFVPGLRKVASQYEQTPSGIYRGWVLFAVPRSGASGREVTKELQRLQSKRRRAVRWRSLVPGWAQFYKGHAGRGTFFLVGEAVFTSTLLTGLVQQARLARRIESNRSGQMVQTLRERRSAWRRIAVGSAVAAGALYLASLIDGLHASSDRLPLLSNASLQPAFSPGSGGVRLAWRF